MSDYNISFNQTEGWPLEWRNKQTYRQGNGTDTNTITAGMDGEKKKGCKIGKHVQ